jgi:hypothetical protein
VISPNSSTPGVINYPGDYDYFRLQLTSASSVTVYSTGTTDTYGYLKDARGTDLASNDDSAGYNFRIFRSVSAGTYYVAVRHYSSTGTGPYTLVVSSDPHSFDFELPGRYRIDHPDYTIGTPTAPIPFWIDGGIRAQIANPDGTPRNIATRRSRPAHVAGCGTSGMSTISREGCSKAGTHSASASRT